MKKNKKILYFSSFLLLLIFLLLALYVSNGNSFNSNNQNEQKTQDIVIDRYSNDEYGFSFDHSSKVTIDEIEGEDGKTLVFKSDLGDFQIHITQFDEDIVIDKNRIKRDLPDLKISEDEEILIGGLARGVAFTSKDNDLDTTEIWFVYKNNLYQVSAPLDNRSYLVDIMVTWKFDNVI